MHVNRMNTGKKLSKKEGFFLFICVCVGGV